MLATLLAFLGGSAFRLIWGEISAAWTRYQDHKHELAMLQAQTAAESERHRMQLETIRAQAEAGVQVVRVQAEGDVARTEADAFLEAVKATGHSSGVWWADAWNACIRPALATACIVLIVGDWVAAGFDLDNYSWALVSAVIGVYTADRSLLARGK